MAPMEAQATRKNVGRNSQEGEKSLTAPPWVFQCAPFIIQSRRGFLTGKSGKPGKMLSVCTHNVSSQSILGLTESMLFDPLNSLR